ncbi:MAG: sigma-70 region 4 domain-containing protein, partial [Clostridia bacterium]|nr:sigma-70 region 4 domain-containing protein [Clostridia bacterium]
FDILNRAKIDEEQRRILTLRFLYGYTLAEIAKMTDKKPDTVKTKYYRALQKMSAMKGLK